MKPRKPFRTYRPFPSQSLLTARPMQAVIPLDSRHIVSFLFLYFTPEGAGSVCPGNGGSSRS